MAALDGVPAAERETALLAKAVADGGAITVYLPIAIEQTEALMAGFREKYPTLTERHLTGQFEPLERILNEAAEVLGERWWR